LGWHSSQHRPAIAGHRRELINSGDSARVTAPAECAGVLRWVPREARRACRIFWLHAGLPELDHNQRPVERDGWSRPHDVVVSSFPRSREPEWT